MARQRLLLSLPMCGHWSLQWNTCEKRLLAITNVRRALVYESDAMLVRSNECARRGYSDVDHVDMGAGMDWLIALLTCARIQPLYPPVRVRFHMAMFVLMCH